MIKWLITACICICIFIWIWICMYVVFPKWVSGKESACNTGDWGSISESGRSPGVGNDNSLQCWLENPMDRGVWWATGYRVVKSQTRLKQLSAELHIYWYVCVYMYIHIHIIYLCLYLYIQLLLLLLSRLSHVQLCASPQTAAHQALLSLGFSRQEHWSGLPFHSAQYAYSL